ncbi:hypothetical protein HMI54_005034 [Coelomomyces lativittatus]|nr:hypothetical protein HMI55_005992 [Coelomomyces lativittatus]KAJ1506498.1 hypothetical protein HMI54_005034 [Coelomomyces lativittatus]
MHSLRFTAIFLHGTLGPQLHQAIKTKLLASPLFHKWVQLSQKKSSEVLSKSSSVLKKIQDTHRYLNK